MDFKQLRSFVATAKHLNFTEAAKQLFIDQSTLSKHISDLEETLGVELFIRDHRSVELTAAGKYLLKEGISLIATVAEIVENTRQSQLGIRGNLKLGCIGIEHPFMPYALKRFRSLYPQIRLDIQVDTDSEIEDGLQRRKLDLGFTVILGNEIKYNRFNYRLIQKLPFCAILPPNHPLAAETAINLADLANDTFVLLSETVALQGFNWITNLCERHGFSPKLSKTTQVESIFWQVEAGIGVSFTIRHPAMQTSKRICLIDILDDDAFCNTIVIWNNKHVNPAVPLFLKVIESINPDE